MAIEDEMSKCIVYNLSILSHVIKPSGQFEEVLTDGLFLRTNNNAFIQVTYYLFNILDSKEFKKKFYWPIIDKKSENSYRTNSVEFINMLIDRFNINHEKIKQVTVVHPSGKKFMSLILDITKEAIKEVMKRKKISSNISLDIEKTEKVINTISEIENDIMGSMKTEIKAIKDKTSEIQELINSIYPNDDNSLPFEEFIKNWHALNKTRLQSLKEKDEKVKEICTKTHLLQEKAHKMLSCKKYEIVQPSSNQIKELAEFYQHLELPIDKQLNIVSLLLYLESTLSIIQNYIKNFSYDEVDISQEEMKIVKRKLIELQNFEPLIKKMTEKEKEVKEKMAKVRAEKEESKLLMEQTLQDEDDKLLKEAQARTLLSPRYNFDTSRNSVSYINIKRNLLAFADNENTSKHDHSMAVLNQTKMYRHLSDPNLNRTREMGPPLKPQSHQQNKPPSRRRRRDPMQLMEQAISTNKNKLDLNTTGAAIPKIISSTPFSSTMLSPDLIHHPNINFSMISDISSVSQTPLTAFPHRKFHKVTDTHLVVPTFHKPDVLAEEITWNNSDEIQQSQITKTDPLERKPLHAIDGIVLESNNSPVLPKLLLDESEISSATLTTSNQNTVCEKENFGCEVDTIMFSKKQACEEDLLNISDSILVDND